MKFDFFFILSMIQVIPTSSVYIIIVSLGLLHDATWSITMYNKYWSITLFCDHMVTWNAAKGNDSVISAYLMFSCIYDWIVCQDRLDP